MGKVLSTRSWSLAFLIAMVLPCHGATATEPQPREPWTTSHLQGTPTPPEPFRIVPAFPQLKFDHPTSLQEIPGTNRLLVTEIGGRVFTFQKDAATDQADLVVDLQALAGGKVRVRRHGWAETRSAANWRCPVPSTPRYNLA